MTNESNLLFDVLGIAIGFSGFILLLSLLVTSISQILQSAIGLRYFNLRNGLTHVLNEVLQLKNFGKARELTEKILRRPINNWFWPKWIGNPGVTWIEPSEFVRKTIEVVAEPTNDRSLIKARDFGPPAIERSFLATEPHMKERFQVWMRVVTAAVALIVAFFFQVNSLDVLKKLSVDPEMRKHFSEVAESQMPESEQQLAASRRYDSVSDSALVTLGAAHPELNPVIEEASGMGSGRDEVVAELSLILADRNVPNSDEVLRDYKNILDSLYSKSLSEAVSTTLQLLDKTALYNLHPWPQGSRFYCQIENWVGVLVTVIFLSLGAPFWFETLRKLMALRDQLKSSDLDKRLKE